MTSRRRFGRGLICLVALAALVGCEPATSAAPSGTQVSVAAPSLVPAGSDRFPDGLPRALDGRPVLRGQAAIDAASAASDLTPFLIGGWVTYSAAAMSCPLELAGDTSWLNECGAPALSDLAGATDPILAAAVTFRFVLSNLNTGPVVAEVEVHDLRAASCGSTRPACDRLMVVQQVLWTGDAATAPGPITADAIAGVLHAVQPGAPFQPLARDGLINDCGDRLPAATLYVPVTYVATTPRVTLVEIEPSSDARARALALPSGVDASSSQAAILCTDVSTGPDGSSSSTFRWLAVANVAVLVRLGPEFDPTDHAFLTSLASALLSAAG